jgi:hypothetical protein
MCCAHPARITATSMFFPESSTDATSSSAFTASLVVCRSSAAISSVWRREHTKAGAGVSLSYTASRRPMCANAAALAYVVFLQELANSLRVATCRVGLQSRNASTGVTIISAWQRQLQQERSTPTHGGGAGGRAGGGRLICLRTFQAEYVPVGSVWYKRGVPSGSKPTMSVEIPNGRTPPLCVYFCECSRASIHREIHLRPRHCAVSLAENPPAGLPQCSARYTRL